MMPTRKGVRVAPPWMGILGQKHKSRNSVTTSPYSSHNSHFSPHKNFQQNGRLVLARSNICAIHWMINKENSFGSSKLFCQLSYFQRVKIVLTGLKYCSDHFISKRNPSSYAGSDLIRIFFKLVQVRSALAHSLWEIIGKTSNGSYLDLVSQTPLWG